jgi:hypothetical protein
LYLVSRGAYIAVHNNSHLPNTQFEGVTVPTGQITNIKIDRNFYYNLGSPYNDCRKDLTSALDADSDHFKNTLKVNQYSQLLCYEICYDSKVIQPQCNCSDPSVPFTSDNVTICYSLSELSCIANKRALLDENPISNYCADDCPLECDTIHYALTSSYSYYPSENYVNILESYGSLASRFNKSYLMFNLPDNGGGGSQPGFYEKNNKRIAFYSQKEETPVGRAGPSDYDRYKKEVPKTVCQVNLYYGELGYRKIEESAALTLSSLFGVFGNI